MKLKSRYGLVFLLALAACSSPKSVSDEVLGPEVQAIEGQVLTVSSGGVANLRTADLGTNDGIQVPEFRRRYASINDLLRPSSVDARDLGLDGVEINRTVAKRLGRIGIPSVSANDLSSQSVSAATAPGTILSSFNGLNHREKRLANGGNMFSAEPPDQGLCVGNGYLLESVNTVLRIRKTDGTPATGVIDLNTFYGYPAEIDRTKPAGQPRFGQFIADPVCLYDQETKRWFHVVLTISVDPISGGLLPKTSLDLAVSDTPDPTGSWTLYRIPTQNDGTNGTPNHGCSLNPDGTGNGPCLADYPQISADGEGIYITANEFSLFGPEFKSANIYAISKWALRDKNSVIRVVNFETPTAGPGGDPGYTLQGGIVPGNDFVSRFGGTQYFLSTTNVFTSTDNRVAVWALTGTKSLDKKTPSLKLINTVVSVNPYGDPPLVDQKAGDFPLGQCINDTTLATPFGPGCWQILFVAEPAHNETLSKINANDARMHKVAYVKERLWAAHTTALNLGGQEKAGIVYYIIKPKLTASGLSAEVVRQGYLAVSNNNVIFPEVAVNKQGKGALAFTLVGVNHFPSAAFATIDENGVGPVQVAAAGVGPQDGFTGYKAFGNPPRPRWGDYGGAVIDPATQNIWLASEYIAQTCTLAQYYPAPPSPAGFGSCGATRTSLANWGTRITLVQP